MATTVVAATYGVLSQFDPDTDSVKSYIARAKVFFKANSIPEEKEAPIFLSCIGARTYDLLESLLAPTLLDATNFETLAKTLEEHFQPKPNYISKRYTFGQRNQQPAETIAQYLAALRKLASDCNFGSKELLEEALRDRLVSGVTSIALRKKLLATKDLTFAVACETAKSMEAAEVNAKAIGNPTAPVTPAVHLLSNHPRRRGKPPPMMDKDKQQPCYRCGRRNHLPKQCKFLNATCHACSKRGHIAPACRSKSKPPQTPPAPFRRGQGQAPSKTNYVGVQSAPEEEELHLFTLGHCSRKVKPIRYQLTLDGIPVWMELDTGAEVSVLPESTYLSLFPEKALTKSAAVLKTYTGESIPVIGELEVDLQYQSQSLTTRLMVVATDGPALLGRDLLMQIKLDWSATQSMPRQSRTDHSVGATQTCVC